MKRKPVSQPPERSENLSLQRASVVPLVCQRWNTWAFSPITGMISRSLASNAEVWSRCSMIQGPIPRGYAFVLLTCHKRQQSHWRVNRIKLLGSTAQNNIAEQPALPDSAGQHSDFSLWACWWIGSGFPGKNRSGDIFYKNPDSTSTISCNPDGIEPEYRF